MTRNIFGSKYLYSSVSLKKKKKGLDKKINDQESFLQSTEKQFLL